MGMKKQQGHAGIIVLVVIIVLAVLGALGYVFWQNFINKSTTATTQNVKTETQEQKLTKVMASISALPHVEAANGVTKELGVTLDKPAVQLTLQPEQQVNFYGSIFATNTQYSPPGPGVSASDASKMALDKTAVAKILTEAGLTTTTVDNPAASTTKHHYVGKDVICDVSDTQGFSSVGCSTQAEVQRSQNETTLAYEVLLKAYPSTVIGKYTTASYAQTSDKKYQGVYIGAFDKGPLFDAYLVNTSGAGWKYVASSDTSTGSAQSAPNAPSCDVINIPYGNVFDPYGYCKK
jgi:type II secretory pathway pseudopilin PulG